MEFYSRSISIQWLARVLWICVIISQCTGALENAALSSSGASCEASASYKTNKCTKAIDGNTQSMQSAWLLPAKGAIGAWIQVTFKEPYDISKLRVMQTNLKEERSKDLELTFSDGATQTVTLPPHDKNTAEWFEFTLTPVLTSNIKITIKSVYSQVNNGFIELEALGTPFSSRPTGSVASDSQTTKASGGGDVQSTPSSDGGDQPTKANGGGDVQTTPSSDGGDQPAPSPTHAPFFLFDLLTFILVGLSGFSLVVATLTSIWYCCSGPPKKPA